MLGQALLGLINGAFYAILSLGLALIFGMLNVINFAQGALFMLGAVVAWLLLHPAQWVPALLPGVVPPPWLSLGYWPALAIAPIVVGAIGLAVERLLIRPLYRVDNLYGLLLTFGLALMIEGLVRNWLGSSGLPYGIPAELRGATNLGVVFMPNYRLWVVAAGVVACAATWLVIERTSLGARLRAATENAPLVQAFGVNVPRLRMLTFGVGAALAGFAGVLAAPINAVNPNMGSNIIVTVFAVVVIGGMGSIGGSILVGLLLGLVEGMVKTYDSPDSGAVVYVIMIIVLLARPAGLFGRAA